MKKMKKFLSLALAAAMTAGVFAGCGEEKTTGSDNSAQSSSSDSGSSEGTLKIGCMGPLTGDNAAYGEAVNNGAQLAVEEINAEGGINGMQEEFKCEDDEADAEKAVNAYNSLKDWGMQMVMGAVTSGACTAVSAETANDHMFQITPSGTSMDCVAPYDNVFRLCFSDPAQGTKSAEYIASKGLATKIAVIYDSSDTYSSGIYQSFAAEAKNQGLEIVAAEAFTADNKTDFSVQLQKAKDSGAELVFLPIYYQHLQFCSRLTRWDLLRSGSAAMVWTVSWA